MNSARTIRFAWPYIAAFSAIVTLYGRQPPPLCRQLTHYAATLAAPIALRLATLRWPLLEALLVTVRFPPPQ
jgi:hypothetical protein